VHDPAALRARLADVRERIAHAAARAGRDPSHIKLIAVSKTFGVDAVRAAAANGQIEFGENKVQEAHDKHSAMQDLPIRWHLIGHLQSNKARKAVQLFDVIHSLDSVELARRLERICEEEGRSVLPVLVQVDLAGEETKSGISENELPELIDFLRDCRHLRIHGLMVLPPFFDDPEATRPYFQRLRAIRDHLAAGKTFGDRHGELSMGMSHDFEAAIEEGATIVRVGTAIFGEREYAANVN
jgi:PLP dependent protein